MNIGIKSKIDPRIMETLQITSNTQRQIIVYTRDLQHCKDYLSRLGVEVTAELPFIHGCCAKASISQIKQLAQHSMVDYIADDMETHTLMNIAGKTIGVDTLHRRGITGKGVGMAFVDTGLFPHTDFLRPENRIVAFHDVIGGKRQPYDDNGHGSFVSGVAAGSGYSSRGKYKGIAPGTTIVAVKAMRADGSGATSDIMSAMQWLVDNTRKYNIKVACLSLGSSANSLAREDAMVRGVEALWDMGIVVVVAAGNDGPGGSTINVPGISSKVITVGASDDKRTVNPLDDDIASFSSRGPVGRRVKPDLVAPGVNVISVSSNTAYRPGSKYTMGSSVYKSMSGTSVAAPVVAGLAALLLQLDPSMNPDAVKSKLMSGAISLKKDKNAEGKGLVQLRAYKK